MPSCRPSTRPRSSTIAPSRRPPPGRVPRTKRRVVVVGNEADLLAVRLVGDRQPRRARVLADGVLRPIADREDRARQLVLRQREQEVRLILRRIDAALQQVPAGRLVALDARVVAGGDARRRRSRARARAAWRTSGRCCSARRGAACARRRTRATKFETTCSSNCRSKFRM